MPVTRRDFLTSNAATLLAAGALSGAGACDSPPGLFKEASVRDSDEAAARDKIRAVLAEAGRLTNAEIRRLTGLSRTAAARMMGSLIREKKARLVGSGRGAHYVTSRKRPGRPLSAREKGSLRNLRRLMNETEKFFPARGAGGGVKGTSDRMETLRMLASDPSTGQLLSRILEVDPKEAKQQALQATVGDIPNATWTRLKTTIEVALAE
jgi:hypothetical protein